MDNLEQIKSRINIVDLIREYIEVKKAGANWKALCPFHSEKSPSFMISDEKQIWHCFGCNEGGDIFSFVMKIEGIDFTEALRILAKKAGVVLKKQDPAANSQKTKLTDILDAAASFYSAELQKSPSALEYIKKRQLLPETAKQFRIGFSPQGWDGLIKKLQSGGVALKDIAYAGLAIEKDGRFYDRFRGRIMFPIFNHYGTAVGFTARVLPEFDDGKMGKYINTPETMVYKKSEILYGLNFAKQDIKKENFAVVVEGNMDVIALHQAGFKNSIATSGTALTLEQLNILKRHTENLIMSFDSDSAGLAAALRGIDLALAAGFNVKVLEMPKNESGEPVAKDPDELVKKSPELWKKALSSPKHIIEFYMEANIVKFNMGDPHENARFCQLILSEIGKIKNSVERALWIKKLGERTGVAEGDLREMAKQPKKENAGYSNEANTLPRKQNNIKSESLDSKYLSLIFTDLNKFSKSFKWVLPEMLETPELAEFYKNLIFYYNNARPFTLTGFEGWLYSIGNKSLILEQLVLLRDKNYVNLEEDELEGELKMMVDFLKNNFLKKQRKILEQEMLLAEKEGNKDKIEELINKFKHLN
ncbi:MAG: DNA primase [Patescibacteria group bacterium]